VEGRGADVGVTGTKNTVAGRQEPAGATKGTEAAQKDGVLKDQNRGTLFVSRTRGGREVSRGRPWAVWLEERRERIRSA